MAQAFHSYLFIHFCHVLSIIRIHVPCASSMFRFISFHFQWFRYQLWQMCPTKTTMTILTKTKIHRKPTTMVAFIRIHAIRRHPIVHATKSRQHCWAKNVCANVRRTRIAKVRRRNACAMELAACLASNQVINRIIAKTMGSRRRLTENSFFFLSRSRMSWATSARAWYGDYVWTWIWRLGYILVPARLQCCRFAKSIVSKWSLDWCRTNMHPKQYVTLKVGYRYI